MMKFFDKLTKEFPSGNSLVFFLFKRTVFLIPKNSIQLPSVMVSVPRHLQI